MELTLVIETYFKGRPDELRGVFEYKVFIRTYAEIFTYNMFDSLRFGPYVEYPTPAEFADLSPTLLAKHILTRIEYTRYLNDATKYWTSLQFHFENGESSPAFATDAAGGCIKGLMVDGSRIRSVSVLIMDRYYYAGIRFYDEDGILYFSDNTGWEDFESSWSELQEVPVG